MLEDYKSKFNEFSKSIKAARKTMGDYEKEINNLGRRVNVLQDEKQKALNGVLGHEEAQPKKKKNKKKGTVIEEPKKEMPKPNLDEMIEKMKADWEAEKQKML